MKILILMTAMTFSVLAKEYKWVEDGREFSVFLVEGKRAKFVSNEANQDNNEDENNSSQNIRAIRAQHVGWQKKMHLVDSALDSEGGSGGRGASRERRKSGEFLVFAERKDGSAAKVLLDGVVVEFDKKKFKKEEIQSFANKYKLSLKRDVDLSDRLMVEFVGIKGTSVFSLMKKINSEKGVLKSFPNWWAANFLR